jgi:hypothetical protein
MGGTNQVHQDEGEIGRKDRKLLMKEGLEERYFYERSYNYSNSQSFEEI